MSEIDKFIEKEQKLMELEYEFVKDFVQLRKDMHLSQ